MKVFLKIYHIMEKFVFISRSWFSFGLLNFVESFSITLVALLEMVFAIRVMGNFSTGETFTTVIISVVWAEVPLLDFECFEILCRSMVSFNLMISFMKKTLSQRIVIHATNNHILYWRVMESFKFTFWTKFFQFCDKVMEVLPFMLYICKKPMAKYSDVLSWIAIFRELL